MAYDYHKKRILITQNSLSNYAGSEIVTLELATFFKNHGAEVVVFTWYYNDPIKKEFEKRDIYVTTDENNPLFDNLDLIWVHHQVLPQRFIIEKKFLGSSSPLIIFNHMSYKEDLFLEQPYIYELEKHLADKSIFVSKESLEMNLSKNKNAFIKPSVLNNLSPEEFIENPKTPTELKKIGIVSNHPPEEIKNLLELFKTQSIDCEIIGHKNNIYDLVTPDLLKKYDCIISIGKTVQYCLTLNIPVYVYDEFGGCGYLNEKNFAKALERNFSGRGFSKKNPRQITQDLINNYQKAVTYQTTNRAKFEKLFSFENITNLLSNIPKKKKPNLNKAYLNYLISAETIAKDKVVAEYLLNLERTIFQKQINDYRNVINSMENSRAVKTAVFLRNLFHKSPPPTTNLWTKDYEILFLKKPREVKNLKIIGLIREKDESLILEDTLNELSKIVDGFIILDDCSSDNSIDIAKKFPKCLAVIKHLTHVKGDRSMEESIHRELLLDLAKKYRPSWIFYQDADERIENPLDFREFMLDNINSKISGIRLSLFDAYMTEADKKPYISGPLYDFRKMFGPERRDIIMAWKNSPDITFMVAADLREPQGIKAENIVTNFFVQHYGKALSEKQWEETCDYYIKHFPQYAEKWQARKGKAIHKNKSDFDRTLESWESVKKSGGVKIN